MNNSDAFSQVFLETLLQIISSKQCFLLIQTILFLTASVIGYLLTKKYNQRPNQSTENNYSFYFLLIILISIAVESLSWIARLSYQLGYLPIDIIYVRYLAIIAWVFSVVMYQCLALFIENISESKLTLRFHQGLFFVISSIFIFIFLLIAIATLQGYNPIITLTAIFRVIAIYRTFIIIPSICIAFYALSLKTIPNLIKEQLFIFLTYYIIPLLIVDTIEYMPLFYSGAYGDLSPFIGSVCAIIMIQLIIFATFRLLKFRLFNFSEKVDDQTEMLLDKTYKEAVFALGGVYESKELLRISNTFLKINFDISKDDTMLVLRFCDEIASQATDQEDMYKMYNIIERYLYKDPTVITMLKKHRVLVSDEISYDAYSAKATPEAIKLADFMQTIDCQVFLPMYNEDKLIAYLAIKQKTPHHFYTNTEQEKMAVLSANLMSNMVIMDMKKEPKYIADNKALTEELHLKRQEAKQYIESIRYLLKQKSNENIGVMIYKKDKFYYGNEIAQQLLEININNQHKHPISLAITKLAQQVEAYRSVRSVIVKDSKHTKIMVTAIPPVEPKDGVVLTVHHPDSCDVIKNLMDKLQDPTHIDYLLYLETTKVGRLINKLLPSNSEIMLNFKISLLEMCLHAKANLVSAHQDDLMDVVEIIHLTSLRTTLHVLELRKDEPYHDTAIRLFGINKLFVKDQPDYEEPILEKLDKNGTLFIQNVDCMDLQTQNKLALFIRYGLYTVMHSEKKIYSDVRIICSVSKNPQQLLEENKLSIELYKQLHQSVIQIPSLLTIDDQELQELMQAYIDEALRTNTLAHILKMSRRDEQSMMARRSMSLQEFKIQIQQMLRKKSTDFHLVKEVRGARLDDQVEEEITNPALIKAANLGRYALKDKDIMTMLWKEFHCQAKIAKFLGVNRSSVQRRCKKYGLVDE